MVSLQILSKVINTKDNSIIEDNALTQEYFPGYADEFNFIQDHIKTYGNVPDAETFFDRFPKAELVEVTETDDYLLDKLLEEHSKEIDLPALGAELSKIKGIGGKRLEEIMAVIEKYLNV